MGEASIEVFLVNGIDGDSEWPFYGISALCHATLPRRKQQDAACLVAQHYADHAKVY